MNTSQLVDVAVKSIQQRTAIEERRCKTKLFLAVALDSPKASNLKRSKALLGKEQYTYSTEEGHWKTNSLDQNRRTMKEPLYGGERGTLCVKRPGGSLGFEGPNSPQKPQVKLTLGNELITFLIDLTLKLFTRKL